MIMKKLFLAFALLLSSVASFATVKMTDGSVNCLAGTHQFDVVLDLDNIKYQETRPFSDFLAIAPRADEWQLKSLRIFSLYFNQVSRKYGLMSAPVRTTAKYVLYITPENVDSKGRLRGKAYLKDAQTSETMATFSFSTNDGDNNDDITFQDPLSELGEDLAKLLKKQLK